jgi:hypothetical protein
MRPIIVIIAFVVTMVGAFAFNSSQSQAFNGAAETCFSKGEKTDGLNKICYYDCPSGEAAITIQSYKLCPLTIKR